MTVKRYYWHAETQTYEDRDAEECMSPAVVSDSDYMAAIEALGLLFKEMELSGNLGSKDYGWPKAITAARAVLDYALSDAGEHQ
jgi:hypothetical protein